MHSNHDREPSTKRASTVATDWPPKQTASPFRSTTGSPASPRIGKRSVHACSYASDVSKLKASIQGFASPPCQPEASHTQHRPCRSRGRSLTSVPLLLPRSLTFQALPSQNISACRSETLGSLICSCLATRVLPRICRSPWATSSEPAAGPLVMRSVSKSYRYPNKLAAWWSTAA